MKYEGGYENGKSRMVAADVLRCVACYLVISIHFLMNSGFYSTTVYGKKMFLAVLIRCACTICVPLFLILSGYLMNKAVLNYSYYVKRIRIIGIYILASIMCEIYNIVYLHQARTLLSCIKGILSFTSAKYSWYVEMYIGLALLIPFLNIMWNSISNKKGKIVLVMSLIIITSLPSIINVYRFSRVDGIVWWLHPAINLEYTKLIPDKWYTVYPITYYFMGCYLREYKLPIKKRTSLIFIILLELVFGAYVYWRSYENNFVNGPWSEYYSLFVLVLAALVFDLFFKLDYSKIPEWLKKMFKFVSGLSLGIYLLSSIFDNMFYAVLNSKMSYMPDKLKYIFVMVPLVFICSMGLSFIINCIYNGLYKGCLKIKELK